VQEDITVMLPSVDGVPRTTLVDLASQQSNVLRKYWGRPKKASILK
jgi:hypothetical protein